jgi:hypothetical protein
MASVSDMTSQTIGRAFSFAFGFGHQSACAGGGVTHRNEAFPIDATISFRVRGYRLPPVTYVISLG